MYGDVIVTHIIILIVIHVAVSHVAFVINIDGVGFILRKLIA